MSDQSIERQIQAKGLTAPRITPTDIEENIASTHYFTAADGVVGAIAHRIKAGQPAGYAPAETVEVIDGPLRLLTFCVLVLRNGFTVTGESACASPENFSAEIGQQIARKNAIDKVWPLMGYQLRDHLHRRAVFDAEPTTSEEAARRADPPSDRSGYSMPYYPG